MATTRNSDLIKLAFFFAFLVIALGPKPISEFSEFSYALLCCYFSLSNLSHVTCYSYVHMCGLCLQKCAWNRKHGDSLWSRSVIQIKNVNVNPNLFPDVLWSDVGVIITHLLQIIFLVQYPRLQIEYWNIMMQAIHHVWIRILYKNKRLIEKEELYLILYSNIISWKLDKTL